MVEKLMEIKLNGLEIYKEILLENNFFSSGYIKMFDLNKINSDFLGESKRKCVFYVFSGWNIFYLLRYDRS